MASVINTAVKVGTNIARRALPEVSSDVGAAASKGVAKSIGVAGKDVAIGVMSSPVFKAGGALGSGAIIAGAGIGLGGKIASSLVYDEATKWGLVKKGTNSTYSNPDDVTVIKNPETGKDIILVNGGKSSINYTSIILIALLIGGAFLAYKFIKK